MPIRRTSNRSSYDSGFYNPEVYSDVGSRVVGYDSDALVYINAVEAADGQALEGPVKDAYNTFVVGCKSDGIWSAIKASCIMAGARTLSGALQPLVGTAPTNNNFVAGDYNRITGLVGNGSTKYLDSNRANNADPQNNAHSSVYCSTTQIAASIPVYLGAYELAQGMRQLRGGTSANELRTRMQNATLQITSTANQPGFIGISRSQAASYTVRGNSTNFTVSQASASPTASRICLFAQYQSVNSTPDEYTNARLAFYSIGESLDLALLDARVDRLINDIAFFINTGLSPTAYDIDTLKYVNRGYVAGGSLS